jgi:hypothetical protein
MRREKLRDLDLGASILSGKYHAAIACVDVEQNYSEDGITMMRVSYIDFAVKDLLRSMAPSRPGLKLSISGDVFCTWDNQGKKKPIATYVPPDNILESGPFLTGILEQDEEAIERCAHLVVETANRRSRPWYKKLMP